MYCFMMCREREFSSCKNVSENVTCRTMHPVVVKQNTNTKIKSFEAFFSFFLLSGLLVFSLWETHKRPSILKTQEASMCVS